ncbi:mechanosensitive ion channel [Propioniciclava sinopodophylli]|uniref:Mechanosensitive ion channel n=1 Tax=Propioniciclava sinopodophylli TaxID=1837344 RepID=A0A4Q9KD58_9ACTN|nr:mechanosensitive ion channel domain-containing protein [Propioniciclava sinopodophylli]TBT83214.1 mechanosensitive ion channel [Propioniciclava sinopodophylli]
MTPLVTFTWPESAISIGVVLLVAIVLRFVLRRAIRTGVDASIAVADRHRASESRADRLLGRITGTTDERHLARVKTMGSVLTNAVDIIVVLLVLLTVMRVLAIPLEPVLAASGIGGIALAFGAQSLIKDYISGMLMIFEDQFGVGDLIDTGEVKGTVEEVGLRVTRLRDAGGQIWYVRNGEILRIGNQSQGWSTGTVDVPIASTEDPARAIQVLRSMVKDMYADERFAGVLLEEPDVAGVNEVRAGATTIRIFAKTAPNQHWGVQRELLERGVQALHAAGIRGPVVFPPDAAR